MEDQDKTFYERADAHIHLANNQVSDEIGRGMVSASFMYAVARYNAYVSACGYESKEQMVEKKQDIIEYFSTEYRKMLEENLDDYINNFDSYMKPKDS
jgi:hypothetical protein